LGFTLEWPAASSPFSADEDDNSEEGEDSDEAKDSEDRDAVMTEVARVDTEVSAERQEDACSHPETDEVDNPHPSDADRSSVPTETTVPADWFF
jgi:hypothetical protein